MKPPLGNEYTAVLAVAERVMQSILGDAAVWAEAASSVVAKPLPWPPPERGEGYPQLLNMLALVGVELTLEAIQQAEGVTVAADPSSPDFQLILRVVHRALRAADSAVRREFKPGRLGGKREFTNWIKADQVEVALRSGAPRAEALGKLSISPAAAYRAMKRRR